MDDWGGLENRCGLWATVGSNPTLSARLSPVSDIPDPLRSDEGFVELDSKHSDPFNDIRSGAGKFSPTRAVQIAKSLGTEVTGVDPPIKLERLRSTDADHVFDYTQEDLAILGELFAAGKAVPVIN